MGDIPLLAEFFVQRYSRRLGKNQLMISLEALALLESYYWPGNVRELKNAIERAVIMAQGPVIRPEHLPEELTLEPTVKAQWSWLICGARVSGVYLPLPCK